MAGEGGKPEHSDPPITMTNRLPPSLDIHYTHQQYLHNTQTFLSHVALFLGLLDPMMQAF